MSAQILKKVEKMEAFAQAALETATAIRKELLDSGVSESSARKGKSKKEKEAAQSVLRNRRSRLG